MNVDAESLRSFAYLLMLRLSENPNQDQAVVIKQTADEFMRLT